MRAFRLFLARWSALALLATGVTGAGTTAIVMARHPANNGPALRSVIRTDSPNWAGYVFTAEHVTGLRADWTEPFVIPVRSVSGMSVWLGIGGFASTDIMQTGTSVFFTGRYGDEEAWYERWPRDPGQVNSQFRVFPDDVIRGVLTHVAGTASEWRVSIKETATGAVWTRLVDYAGPVVGPDFVIEDPGKPSGKGTLTMARWGSVTFSHMQIQVNGRWLPAGEFPAVRIDMAQDGKTTAAVGGLRDGGTSFTARQR